MLLLSLYIPLLDFCPVVFVILLFLMIPSSPSSLDSSSCRHLILFAPTSLFDVFFLLSSSYLLLSMSLVNPTSGILVDLLNNLPYLLKRQKCSVKPTRSPSEGLRSSHFSRLWPKLIINIRKKVVVVVNSLTHLSVLYPVSLPSKTVFL